jgi:hypothetical protein
MSLFEGTGLLAKCVNAEIGNRKGKTKVRMEWEIVEGPHTGKRASYDGKLDADNIKFTKRDMVAAGWQGKTSATFVDDVTKAAKPITIDVEIATHVYEDSGKRSEWSAVRRIGRSAEPLEALDAQQLAKVDSWFAEAGQVERQAPPANGAGNSASAPPPIGDRDLPFASCDLAREPSALARVLR